MKRNALSKFGNRNHNLVIVTANSHNYWPLKRIPYNNGNMITVRCPIELYDGTNEIKYLHPLLKSFELHKSVRVPVLLIMESRSKVCTIHFLVWSGHGNIDFFKACLYLLRNRQPKWNIPKQHMVTSLPRYRSKLDFFYYPEGVNTEGDNTIWSWGLDESE